MIILTFSKLSFKKPCYVVTDAQDVKTTSSRVDPYAAVHLEL